MTDAPPPPNNINKKIPSFLYQFTLPQILAKQAEQLGSDKAAIRDKAYGIWHTYSWSDYLHYSKLIALGLISLGLKRGENVGLILDNQPEWLFAELGAQSLGAVTVSLFASTVINEQIYELNHVRAAYVFAQDQELVDSFLNHRNELTHVRRLIYIDPTGMRTYEDNPWLVSFKDLLELGQELNSEQPDIFLKELWKGKPHDIALMVNTSGTTGMPKLVMLSHENLIETARKWLKASSIRIGDNLFSMSPTTCISQQMWSVGIALAGGMVINFPETSETELEDCRELCPTFFISSPMFWENIVSKSRIRIKHSGLIGRTLFDLSQKIGESVFELELEGKHVPFHLKVLKRLAILLVSRPLMDRAGCLEFHAAYTGGHPVNPDVIHFLRINGVNVNQCYGLTETGGYFQVHSDEVVKPETVGKPLPNTRIKISKDREILVLRKSTFVGYYQDTEASAEVQTDGWIHTGDMGYFDADGHLLIIGRKQNIIRNSNGEVISPEPIETKIKFSPYVKEAVVRGEGCPFLTAAINIDFENVNNWAKERKLFFSSYADLSQNTAVAELIRHEVREVNSQLPSYMQIVKFFLVYKLLDADNEELTRTGKVRRDFVFNNYKAYFDAMYSDNEKVSGNYKDPAGDETVKLIKTKVKILTVR